MRHYVIYDLERKRRIKEVHCECDELAMREFSQLFNLIIRPSRWKKRFDPPRKPGCYVLVLMGWSDADGVYTETPEESGRMVMFDLQVRLSYSYFRHCDPPGSEAEEAELEADFERLDKLDQERLVANANKIARFLGRDDVEAA